MCVSAAMESTSNDVDQTESSDNATSSISELEVLDGYQVPMATQVEQCECCHVLEECTPAYSNQIYSSYYGHFICGMCSAAVSEEYRLWGNLQDALRVHMDACIQFTRFRRRTEEISGLINAARRSLRISRSAPNSPGRPSPLDRANSLTINFSRVPEP